MSAASSEVRPAKDKKADQRLVSDRAVTDSLPRRFQGDAASVEGATRDEAAVFARPRPAFSVHPGTALVLGRWSLCP